MLRRSVVLLLILALGGLSTGCGKDDKVKLLPVEGKVTFVDKPLTTGYVTFYPDTAKGNQSQEVPSGVIDKEGRYFLESGTRKGASPGWYKVAVSAAKQLNPNDPYFTEWLIPKDYIDYKKSGLAVEVVETPAAGAYDFHLKAK